MICGHCKPSYYRVQWGAEEHAESCILRKIFNTTHTYCVYMQIYLEAIEIMVQLTFLVECHSVWLQLPLSNPLFQSPLLHTARELMMVL